MYLADLTFLRLCVIISALDFFRMEIIFTVNIIKSANKFYFSPAFWYYFQRVKTALAGLRH